MSHRGGEQPDRYYRLEVVAQAYPILHLVGMADAHGPYGRLLFLAFPLLL